MIKWISIATVLFGLASASLADEKHCLNRLTENHTRDSYAFNINLDDLEMRDYGNDHLAQSIFIIREALSKAGCNSRNDVNFSKSPEGRAKSYCKNVSRHTNTSRVCFVESSIGYFFVTSDLLYTAHVIFNRWD